LPGKLTAHGDRGSTDSMDVALLLVPDCPDSPATRFGDDRVGWRGGPVSLLAGAAVASITATGGRASAA